MIMKKTLALILALVMSMSLLVGCGSKDTADASASDKADASDDLYIGVYCWGNLEYFYDHKIGLEAAGKMLGVQTKYVGPADGDINAMITAFEQAIAEEPDGIITFGQEETLSAVINKAEAAGIPVVTVDGDVSSSDRTSFVGTGSFSAGQMGGNKLAEAIGGKGKVAIMTQPSAELHVQRWKGYEDALAQYPDIEIVQVGDTKSDAVTSIDVAKAILQAHPDVVGIGCTDAVGGAAVATALEELNMVGKVQVITMDRDQQVLEKIVSGEIYGTLVQNSALMPFLALEILYNLKHADVAVTTDNKAANFAFAPATIDTGVVFVDASNAEYFMRKS
jgi:ribose transport system substrate-binding protein